MYIMQIVQLYRTISSGRIEGLSSTVEICLPLYHLKSLQYNPSCINYSPATTFYQRETFELLLRNFSNLVKILLTSPLIRHTYFTWTDLSKFMSNFALGENWTEPFKTQGQHLPLTPNKATASDGAIFFYVLLPLRTEATHTMDALHRANLLYAAGLQHAVSSTLPIRCYLPAVLQWCRKDCVGWSNEWVYKQVAAWNTCPTSRASHTDHHWCESEFTTHLKETHM